jgi:hypothetical protein
MTRNKTQKVRHSKQTYSTAERLIWKPAVNCDPQQITFQKYSLRSATIKWTVMSGRRSVGNGCFCFDGLRCLARGAVMSSAYDAASIEWPLALMLFA